MWNVIRRWLARSMTRNILQQDRNSLVVLDAWTNVPMGCCDCGLIHRYDFLVRASDGKLCVRARRDFDLTAAMRVARRFTHIVDPNAGPRIAKDHPAHVVPPADVARLERFQQRLDRDARARAPQMEG